jgi:hypothetical protein
MALEISGKVISVLAEQTGSGKNGAWVKQDFVIETTEQYPKKVCFSAWGDKAAAVKNIAMGTPVKVSFNVESREFNGKWYTDLRIWKIETGSSAQSSAPSGAPTQDEYAPSSEPEGANDLPF